MAADRADYLWVIDWDDREALQHMMPDGEHGAPPDVYDRARVVVEQCWRTELHEPHLSAHTPTLEVHCAGLDGSEVARGAH